MDDLVLSRNDFIIYLGKFYYDVRKVNVNLLSFLISIPFIISTYMCWVEGVTPPLGQATNLFSMSDIGTPENGGLVTMVKITCLVPSDHS